MTCCFARPYPPALLSNGPAAPPPDRERAIATATPTTTSHTLLVRPDIVVVVATLPISEETATDVGVTSNEFPKGTGTTLSYSPSHSSRAKH